MFTARFFTFLQFEERHAHFLKNFEPHMSYQNIVKLLKLDLKLNHILLSQIQVMRKLGFQEKNISFTSWLTRQYRVYAIVRQNHLEYFSHNEAVCRYKSTCWTTFTEFKTDTNECKCFYPKSACFYKNVYYSFFFQKLLSKLLSSLYE